VPLENCRGSFFNYSLKAISKQYPGARALTRRLYHKMADDGQSWMIVKTGGKRKLVVPSSEIFKCRKVQVNDDEVLAVYQGAPDHYERTSVMTAFAVSHCTLEDSVHLPGRIIGYKDTYLDVILSGLTKPKWNLLDWKCYPNVKCSSPESYFSLVHPNVDVRNVTARAARISGISKESYQLWVGGSYISTAPTPSSMVKLIKKMTPKVMVWTIDNFMIQIVLRKTLRSLCLDQKKYKFKWDRETINKCNYRPSSSIGFPYCPAAEQFKKKMDVIDDLRERLHAVCELVADGVPIYQAQQRGVSKVLFKPEVRKHTDEPGKVRAIGNMDFFSEIVADLFSRVYMKAFQSIPWCAPGHSMFSSMIPNTLMALCHPDYDSYRDIFKNPSFVPSPPGLYVIVELDLSRQDYTFTPASHWLSYIIRVFFWDQAAMDQRDRRVFINLLTYLNVATHHKVVQWFFNEYYLQRGINTSGDKMTTASDVFEMYLCTKLGLALCLANASVECWWKVLDDFKMIVYGDNTLIRFPVCYYETLTSELWENQSVLHPDKLQSCMGMMGLELNLSETDMLMPIKGHEDRFWTTVINDEVVNRGCTFLQRKFLKISKNNTPLSHRSPYWWKFGLWRETHDYLVKTSNHEFDWDHPTKVVRVALMQKCFSLLYDAGYNRTAHNYIRAIMRILEESEPGMCEWASSCMDMAELRIKVPTVDASKIRSCLREDSFDFVTSHMKVDINSAVLRKGYKI
jgi:hypothetical protein